MDVIDAPSTRLCEFMYVIHLELNPIHTRFNNTTPALLSPANLELKYQPCFICLNFKIDSYSPGTKHKNEKGGGEERMGRTRFISQKKKKN